MTLGATRLQVAAGGQVQLEVSVHNPGHLVEAFRMDVIGLDPDWWQIQPPELAVYPGEKGAALVVLRPPPDARIPDGAMPFAVRARSTLDHACQVAEESALEVARVLDLQATIQPVTSRGRWWATHRLTYTNWGNSAIRIRISASDVDQELGFRVRPEELAVPMGGRASTRIRVRPRRPFLRGTPVRRPFQVLADPGGPSRPPGAAARSGVSEPGRPLLDAAFQQIPVFSRGVVVALVLVLVAGIAGIVSAIMSSRVTGAPIADAQPEQPTHFQASALVDDQIRLTWSRPEGARSYELREIEEENGARKKSFEIPGDAVSYALPAGAPSTRHCYVLIAKHPGTRDSRTSRRACTTTLTGDLPTPRDLRVEPVDNGYRVTWGGDARNRHVVLVDQEPVAEVAKGLPNQKTIQLPAGRHCVQVMARLGETRISRLTPEKCVTPAVPAATATSSPTTTAAAPGTGTGTGTGTGSTVIVPAAVVCGALQTADEGMVTSNLADARSVRPDARLMTLPLKQLPAEWNTMIGVVIVVDHLANDDEANQVRERLKAAGVFQCRNLP
jgi:hypothetical protein